MDKEFTFQRARGREKGEQGREESVPGGESGARASAAGTIFTAGEYM